MEAGDTDTVFFTLTFSGYMSKNSGDVSKIRPNKKEGLLATYSRGRRVEGGRDVQRPTPKVQRHAARCALLREPRLVVQPECEGH